MLLPAQERFPEHKPLLPAAGSREAARADALLRLERRLFSDWLGWLCQAWCVGTQPYAGAEPADLVGALQCDGSTEGLARSPQDMCVRGLCRNERAG